MSRAAIAVNFRGDHYMPLKLKGVLLAHGIKQHDWARAITQNDGESLSLPAASQILNWGRWPKKTDSNAIKRQTVEFLFARGVPKEAMSTMWDIYDADAYRGLAPLGAHLGSTWTSAKPRPARAAQSDADDETDYDDMEVEMLSSAAKKHFRMFKDPFQDDVTSPDDVFLAADQRYISEAMFQTARHGGFLAVIGESGSGKSTLRKLLIERIRDQSIRVIFPQTLDKSRLSTSNICHAIVGDLAPGQSMRASLEGQARQVKDVLLQSSRADYSHVLLIEEAHDLSIATLKYLKRFYELEDGFKKLLSIILIAQPEMKMKLNEGNYPEAREVIRRIEIAELMPLGNALEDYLTLKFKRVGSTLPEVLDKDACDAIRSRLIKTRSGQTFNELYPLKVQNLVIKAMNRAAELGMPLISADLVKEL